MVKNKRAVKAKAVTRKAADNTTMSNLTASDLEGLPLEKAVRAVAALLCAPGLTSTGADVSPSSGMLDARILVAHALGLDATQMIVEARRPVKADEAKRLVDLAARRLAGEPIAYILGEKEFFSLTFHTAPGVLVPRPDSETLIEAALARRPIDSQLRILELGVGSGALMITLLRQFKNAIGVGVDRNPNALFLTQKNARRLGVDARLSLAASDWTSAIDGVFDLIISNPPYIRAADYQTLPVDVRNYEDVGALIAGEDGLDAYRAIVKTVRPHLAPDGLLIFELGAGQAEAVSALVKEVWPRATVTNAYDLAGIARALIFDSKDLLRL